MTHAHKPWLPTPRELAAAPALAIVSALVPTLDIVLVALVAAHDELQPRADGRDAATGAVPRAADEVLVAAQGLAQAIHAYRFAVLEAFEATATADPWRPRPRR